MSKTSQAAEIITAVRAAAEGNTTLPSTLLSSVLGQVGQHQRETVTGSALDQLTARERQVLALVTQGKTHQEIAAQMYISPRTLRNYLSHITAKLGLRQRDQTPRNTQPAEPE